MRGNNWASLLLAKFSVEIVYVHTCHSGLLGLLYYIGYLWHHSRAYICPLDHIQPYLPFGRGMQSTAHLHHLLGLPNQLPLDKLHGKWGQCSLNSPYSVCCVSSGGYVLSSMLVMLTLCKTEVRWAHGGCAISPYKEIVNNFEFECWYHSLMGMREIRPYITVDLPFPWKRHTWYL